LTVQRDQYLPLKVIKEYLDQVDAGKKPVLPNGSSGSLTPVVDDTERYTRAEALERSGATSVMLDEAVSGGLINAKKVYTASDVVALTAIVEAGAFGLEPRHLRGMRLAVDREVGLISQAVSASHGGSKALRSEELREKGRELSGILTTLRQVLTRDALDRLES
jgi:DNA-binding transcriptional MerR regulator